jgi:hypothetical protein
MIITILAEPRSGSTNLANWFYFNKDFTTLFIPSDIKSKWYKSQSPKEYTFTTKHLLIKEDYYHYKNYDELIEISDKVILLYRENLEEQIESWINAKITNNWENQWVSKNIKDDSEVLFFTELKNSFKKEYLDKDYFKISYEELYYNNGIDSIKEYIQLGGFGKFPIGKKYRINLNGLTNLI